MAADPVPTTFAEQWSRSVVRRPNAPFLRFADATGSVTEWTYGEFEALTREVAGGLAERGVGAGDRVHTALANSPAIVAIWLACVRIGAVFVPSDPRASAAELAQHAALVRPAISVHARDDSASHPELGTASVLVDEADVALHELRASAVPPAVAHPPERPAAILFTSGTTSAPKGVVVTQANYAFAGTVMASAATLTQDDRYLVVLPVFHANAQYYSFAAAIAVGASVALTATFSASRFLEQAAAHRATHLSLFAAPIRMILARGDVAVADLRVRHCWYAQNLTASQLDRFAELIGCRPRQLYGMTETLPAVLTQHRQDAEAGVMGQPTPGCAVELLPLDGADSVKPGGVGEIGVRGTIGHSLFGGYFEDPEATERAFCDGVLRTGDLASYDPQGRFRFAGRLGDRLKVGGENVSTAEVEEALAAHPGVLEVAVVGRPDTIYDEVPVAFVVRAPDAPGVTSGELDRHAAERLAPSKRPREITFVDTLPRTSVGKIRKFALRSDARRIALRGIIDYAGLFPPAGLSVPEALAEYLAACREPYAWLLARFACPVDAMAELAGLHATDAARLPLVVPLRPPAGDAWLDAVRVATSRLAHAVDHHRSRLCVEAVELPLPEAPVTAADVVAATGLVLRAAPEAGAVFLEVRPDLLPEQMAAVAAAGSRIAGRRLGAKLRLGGMAPEAVPPPGVVATFLLAGRQLALPLKATAGLHHPIGRPARDGQAAMYGFLNIVAAAALAVDDAADLEAVLSEHDPSALRLGKRGLDWGDRSLDAAALETARASFTGFGCCSVAEPVADLEALDILQELR